MKCLWILDIGYVGYTWALIKVVRSVLFFVMRDERVRLLCFHRTKKSTLRTTFVGAQVYPTYPISNIHRHFIQSYLFSKRISSYKEEAHTVLYFCIWGMFCICVNWRRALYQKNSLIQCSAPIKSDAEHSSDADI